MMNVLFFNSYYPNQIFRFNNVLLWLGSFLRQNGISVKIVNLALYSQDDYKKIIKEKLEKYKPKYVLLSIRWYDQLYSYLEIANEVKKIDKEIKIIIGGHTANFFAKEILKNSNIDVVIVGDGEIPLLRILLQKTPINSYIKKDNRITFHPIKYIQNDRDVRNLCLVNNLEEILEQPKKNLSSENGAFVWFGKGCTHNCFYCGASHNNQYRLYKRRGLIFRPIKKVLSDIEVLSKYTKKFFFDFDSMLDNKYQLKLFGQITNQVFDIENVLWFLPKRDLMRLIRDKFVDKIIRIDLVSYSEDLRRKLAEKRLTKPFFSNNDLEEFLALADKYDIKVKLGSIIGLPGENKHDIKKIIETISNFIQKYPNVINIDQIFRNLYPLSVEPGSELHVNYRKLGFRNYRHDFIDFYEFSKFITKNNLDYPYEMHSKPKISLFGGSFKKTNEEIIKLKSFLKSEIKREIY